MRLDVELGEIQVLDLIFVVDSESVQHLGVGGRELVEGGSQILFLAGRLILPLVFHGKNLLHGIHHLAVLVALLIGLLHIHVSNTELLIHLLHSAHLLKITELVAATS